MQNMARFGVELVVVALVFAALYAVVALAAAAALGERPLGLPEQVGAAAVAGLLGHGLFEALGTNCFYACYKRPDCACGG